MRAMRSPMSPVSAWYAWLCLSLTIHVEYSFCRMRLPATGLTLPWQLVAAQEPGPMYFTGSPFESAFERGGLALAFAEAAEEAGSFSAAAAGTANTMSGKSATDSARRGQ